MSEEYVVNGHIMAYCPQCQSSLKHTIVTMAKDIAEQVQCTTCDSTHQFKASSEPQKGRRPRAKKADTRPPGELASWEDGLRRGAGKERVYTTAEKYKVGDVILHDTFGKGVVLKTSPSKCAVMFEDKKRLMASSN